MTDRLEALERLQRLRESGAIDDAEFEREKALLLRGQPAPPAVPPPPIRRGTPAWVWVLVGIVGVALVAALLWLLLGRNEAREDDQRTETNVQVESNEQAATEPEEETPAIRRRPQAEQLAAAFRAAFGGRTTRSVGDYQITYRPGDLTWIGDRAVLVSPGSNSEECHACAGMVAVHYLEADGDGFRRTGEWLDAATDDYGRPPEWRLTSAFTGEPVLQSDSDGGNQGIFCSITRLIAFPARGPAELVTIPTGYTNDSEEEGAEIEGEIRNIVRGRSFEVAYSGEGTFTERYELRGGRYSLAGAPSRMRTCD